MAGRWWRALLAAVVVALVVAACGDDEATTTAPPTTTGAPTTTAAWGEAVAPGAEAMLQGSRVLLREDFQDGDTAGWRIDSGWYVLENGERRMLGAGGEAWAWYEGGRDWTRYAARLAVVVDGGSLGVSLAVGAEGRYQVQLAEDGVYLLKEAPWGSLQALGSAQPVTRREPHVLAAGLDGGHLQVYVDGRLLIDAVDRAPLAGGSIGLGAAEGSSAVVDNIAVASLGGSLPHLEVVGEPAALPLPGSAGDGAPGAGEGLEGGGPADGGRANLVISGVSYPMQVRYDEAFDVSIRVRNAGEVAVGGAFSAEFLSHGDRCEAAAEDLGAGAEVTLTCRFPGYDANGESVYEWTAAADSGGDVDEGPFEEDNLAAGTITITSGGPEDSLPNLAVAWRTWEPDSPSPDETVVLEIGIAQTQAGFRGDLPEYYVEVLNVEVNSRHCGNLVHPGVDVITCLLPPFFEAGEFEMVILLDKNNEVEESNEDDNLGSFTIVVGQPGQGDLPNLAFGSFDPLAAPRGGQAFTVRVGINCLACTLSTPFTTRLTVGEVVVCSWDWRPGLGFSPECDITLPAGSHQWGVHVDADDDIAESNEDDNAGWGQLTVSP